MLQIINPATLEPLGATPEHGAGDIAQAVARARAAQRDWQEVAASVRAQLLAQIAGSLTTRAREFALLLTQESGKPLCEAYDCIDAVTAIYEAAADGRTALPAEFAGAAVVAVIAPFSFPLLFTACTLAPALAAGRAVLCKPPPQNPLSVLKLLELHGNVPNGVVQVLCGGADTGRALSAQADIDAVSFTGSAEVGASIASASRGRPLDLEAGSIDACIVAADADLDLAVPSIAWARLMNGGQACLGGKQIHVDRSIAAEFVDRMHHCIGFLDVDDPSKRSTDLGPLISLGAAQRVEDQVGRTLREGAKLILGGRRFRPSGLPGYFFQPTILHEVRADGVPCREEILGPVVTITPAANVREAIRHAGGSERVRRVTVFTGDHERISAAMAEFAQIELRINGLNAAGSMPRGPFEDTSHRGLSRILGRGNAPALPGVAIPTRASWWFPYCDRPPHG